MEELDQIISNLTQQALNLILPNETKHVFQAGISGKLCTKMKFFTGHPVYKPLLNSKWNIVE